MNEPRGYWSSVFYQTTVLLKQRPQMGGETAFWMARGIVERNLDSSAGNKHPALPLRVSHDTLVLAP
jgi:hypothetical protein